MPLGDSTKTASMLHAWHHDDYDEAKKQILTYLGSTADLEIFGSQVMVAIYVRPNKNPLSGFIMGTKAQTEDIYNGKVVMVVKAGPNAFANGSDESWLKSQYGDRAPPQAGDWCFVREDMGIPIMFCGDGAKRVTFLDKQDKPMDIYSWDGWPCRIIGHTDLIGRMNKPHTVV